MPRLAFGARLRLVPIDEGGRNTPIRSNYHPLFEHGGTSQGSPVVHGGRVMLVGREELAPGDEGTVQIEPLFPESWNAVPIGMVIAVREGARTVGWATICDVTRAEAFTPAVASFVHQAREFCAFIRDAGKAALPERLAHARRRLLALYDAAVSLPSLELASPFMARPAPEKPSDWRSFEQFDPYWEIFDPYDLQEPVGASLSDDLLDVYRDVGRGLQRWDANADADAIWEWRFSFESHWGDHAIDALRALHRACGRS